MNKTIALLMTLVVVAFGNTEAFAQKGGKKPGNKGAKKTVVVKKSNKPHATAAKVKVKPKYHRSKVVVVKKRQARTITVLPLGYTTVVYKNNNYYHHGGFWYLNNGPAYTVVVPPPGLRLKVLPVGYHTVKVSKINYYYYRGVFYKPYSTMYIVSNPPIGVVVVELPEDNVEEVTIDGLTYYEYNNYLYKSTGNGSYKVVGKLEG